MLLLFKYLPCAMGLIALIVGTFGFHQVSHESPFSTCLYQAAQLFTMNSGAVQGPIPWTLELARWLAPMATLGAVLLAIHALFFSFFTRIKTRLYRDHTILCGAGERGFAIATQIHEHGSKVVVVDADQANTLLPKLRSLGIPVLVGDALNGVILAQAGIKHAQRLIGTCSSDETNLKIAGNLSGSYDGEIIIAVEKPELRSLFRDQIGSGKDQLSVKMMGFQFRAAKKFFYNLAAHFCIQPSKVKSGIHIFLEVKDCLLEDFIRAASLMLQISGEIKPKISILSASKAIKENFSLRYPGASLVADLVWLDHCPSKTASSDRLPIYDAAVFCCNDDMASLERADLFNNLSFCHRKNIFVCLLKPSNATFLSRTAFASANSFQFLDLISYSFGDQDPLDGHLEQDAMKLHHDYVKREIRKDPSWARLPEDWRFLDESFRDSNRLQAAHLEIKRLTWEAFPSDQKDALLDQLTRGEHMRWMADKVMHGWRWSGSMAPPSRDDRKRKHHLLVPFENLSEEEKNKDRDPIRAFLEAKS